MKKDKSQKGGVMKCLVVQNHQRLFSTLSVKLHNIVKLSKYDLSFKSERIILVHFNINQFSKEEIENSNFLLNKFVLIKPCAPVSKQKRFELCEVL